MGIPDVFRGGYVGLIQLVAIIPFSPESWEELKTEHLSDARFKPGNFAWVIQNPRRFDSPVIGAGKLGLFYPESNVAQQLESANLI
jgi:hypothetical protein